MVDSRRRVFQLSAAALPFVWLLITSACGVPSSDLGSDSASTRLENAALGLAVAELPSEFTVSQNDATGLALAAAGDGEAVVRFDVGPIEQGSVNIVEAAKQMQAVFESRPNGEFFGNQELIAPIGSFFTARGAYEQEGRSFGELQAFTLHPLANRLLRVSFRYPADEAQQRAPQFAALLGEIEGYEPEIEPE